MGTRGCVAVRTGPETWRGVYNHFDSYPEGLGREVWEHVKKKGVERLGIEILKFGDWREYLSRGICEYCGEKAGQPHTIEGVLFGWTGQDFIGNRKAKLEAKSEEELARAIEAGLPPGFVNTSALSARREWPILQSIRKTGYPDPQARYHKHGDGKKDQLTESENDPLFIEWVYILDPKRNRLEIWTSRRKKGAKPNERGVPPYEHFKVTEIRAGGPEPNWPKIHRLARAKE